MKNLFFNAALALGLCLFSVAGHGQATYETNNPQQNPFPPGYIGWNDSNNQVLDFKQNNTVRLRMTSTAYPGYNGTAPIANASRMFFGLNGNLQSAFSMMHLGAFTPIGLQRPWMNVGTTYGGAADIMYLGILQRPEGSPNDNIADAVVAWGCNDQFHMPQFGPDNLRFIFLAPTTATDSPGSATEGLETMRITPWGHVGIGSGFSNALQPVRRLDVFDSNTEVAQFRISHTLNTNPTQGTFADFQVFSSGNLHIRPALNDVTQNVAISQLHRVNLGSHQIHTRTAKHD